MYHLAVIMWGLLIALMERGNCHEWAVTQNSFFILVFFFFSKTTGWVQRIYVYQWTLGQGTGPWWSSDMGDQRSPAIFLAEVQAITCCESSRVGICAKAGSTHCLSTCQTQETPWMVVEQSKLWSVIVCSELYIFFYSIYFRATFPGKKSVLLHIIIIIFFFFSFIFSWYIVDPPTWKRQWCCTEVP